MTAKTCDELLTELCISIAVYRSGMLDWAKDFDSEKLKEKAEEGERQMYAKNNEACEYLQGKK